MINIKHELQNYPAIDIDKISGSGDIIPDYIRNSIILYNKALESLRMNSEDIAIIELKKAVSMNPNFYEAINLLGLCYIETNEHNKAENLFQRVTSAEGNGINAYRYLSFLRNSLVRPLDLNQDVSNITIDGENTKKPDDKDRGMDKALKFLLRNRTISGKKINILKYAIGFFAGFMALAILLLAGVFGGGVADLTVNDELVGSLQQKIELLESQNKKLGDDFNAQKKLLDDANTAVDYLRLTNRIFEVQDLLTAKKYEAAGELLLLLNNINFADYELNAYNRLKASVYPLAAEAAHETGYNLYKNEKFSDALKKLERVKVYYKDYKNLDAVDYYIGKCYTALGDIKNAIAAYNRVISQFPNSTFARYSRTRINEFGN